MKEAGIYIHFPFCKSRCRYCDFSTSAGVEDFIPDYCANLIQEIQIEGNIYKNEYAIPTIYLGGGTPSYLPAKCIEDVILAVRNSFNLLAPLVEISLEANPADITPEKCERWQMAGVNRISIGMQSAQDEELKLLGRRHRFGEVCKAVAALRSAGMQNFNLDLIFGLPGQKLTTWQDSLRKALELGPTHLSLYALAVEEATPLAADIQAGIYPAPDDDVAAEMYESAMEYLESESFEQYEISNWARNGQVDYRCRHNLLYWRNREYFGFGAAAHSHIGMQRKANVTNIANYIHAVKGFSTQDSGKQDFPGVAEITPLSLLDDMGETAMMGLRLVREGLRDDLFQERFGKSLFTVYEQPIRELTQLGLLEVVKGEANAIRLTKRGRLLGNQVFLRFLFD